MHHDDRTGEVPIMIRAPPHSVCWGEGAKREDSGKLAGEGVSQDKDSNRILVSTYNKGGLPWKNTYTVMIEITNEHRCLRSVQIVKYQL